MKVKFIYFYLLFFTYACVSENEIKKTVNHIEQNNKKRYLTEVSKSIERVSNILSSSVVYLEISIIGRKGKERVIFANGSIIDEKGHFLTVFFDKSKIIRIYVWYKKKKYEAYLIKNYYNLGYSIMRFIPPEETKSFVFADITLLKRGDCIYGIGTTGKKFDFELVTRFGTISAIINQNSNIIFHNGFSLYSRQGISSIGMPIANYQGEIIGFTSYNIIMANDYAKIAKEKFLKRNKEPNDSKTPWLGVIMSAINDDEVNALGIPRSGLNIKNVHYNSPGEKAGLQVGDILIGMNNQFFTKKGKAVFLQYTKLIKSEIGQKSNLHIWRKGKFLEKEIICEEKPKKNTVRFRDLGFVAQDIRSIDYYNYSLTLKKGVFVNEVIAGGVASKVYFKEDAIFTGDIIIAFDGVEINTINNLKHEINKARNKKRKLICLKIIRGHISSYSIIKPKF